MDINGRTARREESLPINPGTRRAVDASNLKGSIKSLEADVRRLTQVASTGLPGPAGPAGPAGSAGSAGSPGPAGLTHRGTWSAATAYAVNDSVYYAGSSYRRLVAGTTPGDPDFDTSNWAIYALKGDVATVTQDGWTNPSFSAGFANYGSGYQNVQWQKDPAGIVRIRGLAITTAGTASNALVFTLPVGARPAGNRIFTSNSNGPTARRFDVNSDGTVKIEPALSTATYFSLECEFDTGQTTFPAGNPFGGVVTSLPGSPYTGQIVAYQTAAMSTAGILWHLQWFSPYWYPLSDSALQEEISTGQTTASTTYTNLTTTGPSVTVPVTGVYDITFGAELANGTAGSYAFMQPKLGSAAHAAADADAIVAGFAASADSTSARTIRRSLTAGSLILCQYRAAAAGTASFAKRAISVRPVRVG